MEDVNWGGKGRGVQQEVEEVVEGLLLEGAAAENDAKKMDTAGSVLVQQCSIEFWQGVPVSVEQGPLM